MRDIINVAIPCLEGRGLKVIAEPCDVEDRLQQVAIPCLEGRGLKGCVGVPGVSLTDVAIPCLEGRGLKGRETELLDQLEAALQSLASKVEDGKTSETWTSTVRSASLQSLASKVEDGKQ